MLMGEFAGMLARENSVDTTSAAFEGIARQYQAGVRLCWQALTSAALPFHNACLFPDAARQGASLRSYPFASF